jgi:hypothetical protein
MVVTNLMSSALFKLFAYNRTLSIEQIGQYVRTHIDDIELGDAFNFMVTETEWGIMYGVILALPSIRATMAVYEFLFSFPSEQDKWRWECWRLLMTKVDYVKTEHLLLSVHCRMIVDTPISLTGPMLTKWLPATNVNWTFIDDVLRSGRLDQRNRFDRALYVCYHYMRGGHGEQLKAQFKCYQLSGYYGDKIKDFIDVFNMTRSLTLIYNFLPDELIRGVHVMLFHKFK